MAVFMLRFRGAFRITLGEFLYQRRIANKDILSSTPCLFRHQGCDKRSALKVAYQKMNRLLFGQRVQQAFGEDGMDGRRQMQATRPDAYPLFSRIKIERFVEYLGENDEMRTRKRCLLTVLCEVPRLTSLQFVPYFDPLRIICSGGDSKSWKICDH